MGTQILLRLGASHIFFVIQFAPYVSCKARDVFGHDERPAQDNEPENPPETKEGQQPDCFHCGPLPPKDRKHPTIFPAA